MRKLLIIILFFFPFLTFSQNEELLKSLENYQLAELENGMKIIVVKTDEFDYLSYRFILDFQPFFENEYCGVSQILVRLIGCELKNKNQIVKDMVSADNAVDSLIDFMSGVLLRPDFNDSSVYIIRTIKANQTKNYENDYDSILSNYAKLFSFTNEHPYSEHVTENSFNKVNSSELKRIHKKIFIPQNSTLVVVGNIDIEEVVPYAERYFGDWKSNPNPTENYKIAEIPESEIIFIEDKSLENAYISVNYPITYNILSNDFFAVNVLALMLKKTGIVYNEIVENKNFSDDVTTVFEPDKYISLFNIQAKIKYYNVEEYINSIDLLLEDYYKISTSEYLQKSKEEIISNFKKSLERPYIVAQYVYNLEEYELPKNYYSDFIFEINKITPQKIKSAAANYLKPQNANYIIIGNKDELFCAFQKLAIDYEINQYKNKNFTQLYKKGFGAQTIINNFLDTSNAQYYFSDLSIFYDAQYFLENDTILLNGKIYRKNEEFYKHETFVNEDTTMIIFHRKEIFDGKKWLDETTTFRNILEDDLVYSKLYQSFIFPEKHFDKINYSAFLVCDKDLFEQNIYKIIVKTPYDFEFYEYYDILTKQKLLTEKIVNDTIVETYEYSDYELLDNGVTLPMTILQISRNYKIRLQIKQIDYETKLKLKEFKISN